MQQTTDRQTNDNLAEVKMFVLWLWVQAMR